MPNNLNHFFDKKFTYVIVGVSQNTEKYGYKIFQTLLKNDFNVLPLNPKEKEILGKKCYQSILDIKEKVDVVDFVVPPELTLKILKDVKKLNIQKVWFQPGTFNLECLNFCDQNGIEYLKDFCLMESALKNL